MCCCVCATPPACGTPETPWSGWGCSAPVMPPGRRRWLCWCWTAPRPLTAEDEDAIATAAAVPRQLVIVNKTDLPAGVELSALVQRFGQLYPLSAATGEGVDALCRAVEALYPAGKQAQGELLTNARQADAVARSLEAVRSARRALEDGMTPDVVLTDAEAALEALGELNGKRIREDLVQTIFSRFCVGK